VAIQLVMVALVILFPQMVMVYKSGETTTDPSKVRIEIPTIEEEEKPEDLMRDLRKSPGGQSDKGGTADDPAKALEKALQGSPDDSKADGGKEKTPEDKAAEEIERALKGAK
jgi:hypothetical protein